MDLGDDIKLYLPQYLSEDNLVDLKKQLKAFGEGHDSGEYFTTRLKNEPYLFQGDGVKSIMINMPDVAVQADRPVLILSNTCDMDLNNARLNPCRIMYAPILNLDKYIAMLVANKVSEERIDNHIKDIKNQVISQILFLPTSVFGGADSIVLFDRAISVPLTQEYVDDMLGTRTFSLSNYGFYLLLLKLSYHFTRIQEKVNRG